MRRLVLLALLLAACAGPAPGSAPELVLGRTVCEECGMIVSDLRYAAGYVDAGGDHVFDDIGGLLSHLARRSDGEAVTPWVHDHEDPAWVRASDAFYVRGTRVSTPMGFGIAAFADRADASRFAGEVEGAVLGWDDLLADARAGTISAHDHNDHSEGDGDDDD